MRAVDDGSFDGFRNRLIVGTNIQNGTIDTEQFVNLPGAVKGALAGSMADKSRNPSLYAEDSLFVTPGLALIAGVQYLPASRNRHDRFFLDGNQTDSRHHDIWSTRFATLWAADSATQFFA